VTANPTIFARAISGSTDYDEQLASLLADGCSVEAAYWELVVTDIEDALRALRPVFDESGGADGFVSLEVAPELAHDGPATIAAARHLHTRIDAPNLLVKIPATAEGIVAIEAMIAEGRNINVTLIFSLTRYAHVIEAYLAGLEAFVAAGGDPSTVHSVASFFVSRVDSEVDSRLEALDGAEARGERGRVGVAQAKLAYRLFRDRFAGARWDRLRALGANRQRPLWASTSTKDPAYPDTMYVDSLIGPDTVTTLPEDTIERFEDHGTLERTVDVDLDEATETMRRLDVLGIDMDAVGLALERQGVAAFHTSFQHVLGDLTARVERAARAAPAAASATPARSSRARRPPRGRGAGGAAGG
jgi:transaldolase